MGHPGALAGATSTRSLVRTLLAVAATVGVLVAAVAPATAAGVDAVSVAGDAAGPAADTLAGRAPLPVPAPQPAGSLAHEVRGLAGLLGVPLRGESVSAAIDDARLAPLTQSVLAGLLARLSTCTVVSKQLLQRAPLAQLQAAPGGIDAEEVFGRCATDLRAEAAAAMAALESQDPAQEDELRLWPVLAYAPDASATTYHEDYALVVDRGGNDRYRNNQGGNTLDLKRSVTNPNARYTRPARGCEAVFPDATTGRIKRGPVGERLLSNDGPECSPAAALLLDLGGDDRYGSYQRPHFPDSICTRDPLVRRISTLGSGVAGVGMLIDAGGDDVYLGKTGTQGAGHLGGIGLLEDRGGDDAYRAIRGAQGLGLLGGLGVLRDLGGSDSYDYRMPRPLNPKAKNQTDGAGGVVDDTGLGSEAGLGQQPGDGIGGTCDRLERSLQGVGLLAGTGILMDEGGADSFRAPGYDNQPFFTLQGATIHLAHGSQGSGYLAGSGFFADLGGRDRYLDQRSEPSESRADGVVIGPRVTPSLDEDGPGNGKPLDASAFYDSGR